MNTETIIKVGTAYAFISSLLLITYVIIANRIKSNEKIAQEPLPESELQVNDKGQIIEVSAKDKAAEMIRTNIVKCKHEWQYQSVYNMIDYFFVLFHDERLYSELKCELNQKLVMMNGY